MPAWMTIQEAADYLRVHRATIHRFIQQGKLIAYAMPDGGRKRVKREDLDALLTPDSEEPP